MVEVTQGDDFELNADQLDALRLESQSLSPAELAKFRKTVIDAHHFFLKKMGKYLPEGSRKSDDVMVSKFIPIDDETYKTVFHDWVDTEGAKIQTYIEHVGPARAFNKEGNFVVVMPIDTWSTYSEETKKTYMERLHLSAEEAKQFVNTAVLMNVALHEMTHLYQGALTTIIPIELVEAQAYWVAREAAPENIRVTAPPKDEWANRYQYLLDTFGEEVHSLGFDKVPNLDLIRKISTGRK